MLPSDPALREWLQDNLARGCAPDAMLAAMLASGHDEALAKTWLNAAQSQPQRTLPLANPDRQGFVFKDVFAKQNLNGLNIRLQLQRPRVLLIEDFLSAQACQTLMDLARAKLETSTVIDPLTGQFRQDVARHSEGTSFAYGAHPVISELEANIAAHFGFAVAQQEPLQILHYRAGGHYAAHYDYFDPALPGSRATLAERGQRIATLVMYLQAADAGGGTGFPHARLSLTPRAGSVIYFENCREVDGDLVLETQSLHAGEAVQSGEKWIATKWIRQARAA